MEENYEDTLFDDTIVDGQFDNSDDSIVDDDLFSRPAESTSDEPEEEEDFSSNDNSSYEDMLLKAKGIDRHNIQIYNEAGELEYADFNDLSDEDKAALLAQETPYESPISDEELETINFLRQNGLTLQDFANLQRQQALAEAQQNVPQQTDIDKYSDEEVIAYDFINRFGDSMTDEEIDAEIERLKEDEEAFAKRVNLLRQSYKTSELAALEKQQKEQQEQQKQMEQEFINSYVYSAQDLNDIQGVTLEDNDKEELLDFVLTKDAAGRTGLSKALDDPNAVLRMAWYLLHGEETFDATIDYYKNQITQSRRSTPKPPRAVKRAAPTRRVEGEYGFDESMFK